MAEKSDFQNRRLLLLHLLDCGSATKQNLVQWSGLSNTTVSDTINAMRKTGLVHTVGMQKSLGGRRSVVYSIDGDYGRFAGIDLRASEAIVALCSARGQTVGSLRVSRRDGEPSIGLLYRAIDELLGLPDAPRILALGIGVEGQIDHETQTVLKSSSNNWNNVPLKEIVERRIYLPTFIDNTINGQVSLRKYLLGRECPRHFMVLNDQFCFKAALCIDGRLCHGRKNRCGDAGDFPLLVREACQVRRFLGLERVWIACGDEQRTEEVRRELAEAQDDRMSVYLADSLELAWGMSLEAETKWFGTIYSSTKRQERPSSDVG